MSKVAFEKTDTAYRITLNDPPLHILDITCLSELREALLAVRDDRHLLIIDSTGEKAFSAGASVQDHTADRVGTMLELFHDCFRLLDRLELATVAIVQGVALGGGCELAMACDFVLASDNARFGQPEINLGVFPPVAAYQLSRQTSPRRGLELLLTGEPVDAGTALMLGMVNAVFSRGELEERCNAWLGNLTKQSASSLRLAKRAFRLAANEDFPRRLAVVERLYLDELMKTSDAVEGLAAFMEKRRPAWKNE